VSNLIALCPNDICDAAMHMFDEDVSVACRVKDRPDIMQEVKFFAATPLVAANGYRLGSL
jgi:hypothetical protein